VTLPGKWQRMLIGAAGMIAELGLAAIAVWLWTGVSGGVTKAVLHQVVILAGVTTLIFNANPLLRFDGYYILSDALEIPNLSQRANRYVGYLVRRYLFRSEARPPLHLTAREPLAHLFRGRFGDLSHRGHRLHHRAGGGAVLCVRGAAGPVGGVWAAGAAAGEIYPLHAARPVAGGIAARPGL
jgi:hypothetical protein